MQRGDLRFTTACRGEQGVFGQVGEVDARLMGKWMVGTQNCTEVVAGKNHSAIRDRVRVDQDSSIYRSGLKPILEFIVAAFKQAHVPGAI